MSTSNYSLGALPFIDRWSTYGVHKMNVLWIFAGACALLFIFALVQKLVKIAVVSGVVLILCFTGFVLVKDAADPATAGKMDEAASALGKAAGTAAKKTADVAAPLAKKAADAAKPHAEKAVKAASEKTAEIAGKVAEEMKDKLFNEVKDAMLRDDDDSADASEPSDHESKPATQ